VLKRNAQFPLDVHEGARHDGHLIHPRCSAASNKRIATGLWGSIVMALGLTIPETLLATADEVIQ
jgi:hypothetical protein